MSNKFTLSRLGIYMVKMSKKPNAPWFLKLLMKINEIEKDEECPYIVMNLKEVKEMIVLLETARDFIKKHNRELNEDITEGI